MTGSAPATGDVPLVGTKLRAPTVARGYRERSRLSARLDAALEDQTRLTLLSAPPGYGTTVAVTGCLPSRGLTHAWLALDPADDDLVRFSRYLAEFERLYRDRVDDWRPVLSGARPAEDRLTRPDFSSPGSPA